MCERNGRGARGQEEEERQREKNLPRNAMRVMGGRKMTKQKKKNGKIGNRLKDGLG